MLTFPDLAAFENEINGGGITLPIAGKQYVFSGSIPARTGLTLAKIREQVEAAGKDADDNQVLLTDQAETVVMQDLIGDQWDVMEADGVPWPMFRHVYITLFTWHMVGPDAAMRVWSADLGVEGDARPPARGTSQAPRTSRSSSTRKPSNATRSRRSAGKTS